MRIKNILPVHEESKPRAKQLILFRIPAVFLLVVFMLTGLGACAKDQAPKRFTKDIFGAFDTVVTIIGYEKTAEAFDNYAKIAEERFVELHQLFDKYNSYEGVNNIYTINQNAGLNLPVQVSQEIIDLLDFSIELQQQYPDTVNIALGSVLELWHDARTDSTNDPARARLPEQSELEQAAAHTSIDSIVIDRDNKTVMITDPQVQLDLGAVAKGYATELVTESLLSAGWSSFIISSGGNIKTTQAPLEADRDKWKIGIQNPFYADDTEQKELLFMIGVTEQSVVTSGDYQRFFTVNNQKYHHIIDPATLFPADHFAAVTVVTPDSGLADFLSTLFFILPYEQGLSYADQMNSVEVVWVLKDGTTLMTEGMKSLILE